MDDLMKFDPATGWSKPYPSHAAQWREHHGKTAWLFNPWTGVRRNAQDVGSDPFGLLVHPGAALSAQPADKPAISSPSSAGNPCPAPVPAYPETGNSHTDGGAVYG